MGDEYWYGKRVNINQTKAAINYAWVAGAQESPQVYIQHIDHILFLIPVAKSDCGKAFSIFSIIVDVANRFNFMTPFD